MQDPKMNRFSDIDVTKILTECNSCVYFYTCGWNLWGNGSIFIDGKLIEKLNYNSLIKTKFSEL